MMPILSVVVTTYENGRLNDIDDLTKSIALQQESNFEVIFVVEGSRAYASRVESICRCHLASNWKVILNTEKPGISASRNIGVKNSGGSIVAFVDDDVLLPKQWAQTLVDSFSSSDVGAVTGGAWPLYMDTDASWLPSSLHWLIGSTDWYHQSRRSETRAVWGMNMAFRRFVFDRGLEFPERVGGVHGRNIHGEEQVISYRVRTELGMKVVFDPNLVVLHKVYKFRLAPRQVWKNAFHMGRTRRMIQCLYDKKDPLQIERSLIRRMAEEGFAKPLFELWFSPRRAVRTIYVTAFSFVAAALGYLSGLNYCGGRISAKYDSKQITAGNSRVESSTVHSIPKDRSIPRRK
ncbi:MAG: glycosyltransferase family 2 protein [Candidatus Parvarchaeota archaeon]